MDVKRDANARSSAAVARPERAARGARISRDEHAEETLRFLSNASAVAVESLDYVRTFQRVAELAVPFLADWCAIDVLEEKRYRRVAASHVVPERVPLAYDIQRRFQPREDAPGYPTVLHSGKPFLAPQVTDESLIAAAKSPEHLAMMRALGFRSYMCVPLVARGRTLGAITFVIVDDTRSFGAADLRTAEELAASAALALDNARLFRDAETARRRAEILAKASRLLSEEAEGALQAVAQLAVPELGDWVAIDILGEDGAVSRQVLAHADETQADWGRSLRAMFPRRVDGDGTFAKALRTGKSELVEMTDERLRRATSDEAQLEMLRKLQLRWMIVAPIRARSGTFGTLTFASSREDRRYDAEDLAVAEDLAERVGLAIDNARLFATTMLGRHRAELLAEVSRILADERDLDLALSTVARIAVPDLGDFCMIVLRRDDGALEKPFIAHVDPAKVEIARRVWEESLAQLPYRDRHPALRALDTGRSIVNGDLSDDVYRAYAKDERQFQDLLQAAARSALHVPIRAHDRTIGVLVLTSTSPARRFTERDLPLAEDVAARIALAIENARLHEREQEAVRSRDEFLSVASHELRTPLSALRLMVRVLRNSIAAGRDPAEVARDLGEKLDLADRQLKRITEMVARLLDVSRIQAGPSLAERTPVDAVEVAREVIARFVSDSETSRAAITLQAPPSIVGHWDRFRVEQTLTNLLSNALKYGEGKPVELILEQRGDRGLIVVRDHGTGMPPEVRARLFERHFRAQKTGEGLGLGLYIVNQLVKSVGGTIEVDSEPGRGTTITVDVPRDVGPAE